MPNNRPVIVAPSPSQSPVNYTALATVIAALATRFGLPIDAQMALDLLTVIAIVGPALVMMFRTFFPGKEATTPQLRAAIAEKKADT